MSVLANSLSALLAALVRHRADPATSLADIFGKCAFFVARRTRRKLVDSVVPPPAVATQNCLDDPCHTLLSVPHTLHPLASEHPGVLPPTALSGAVERRCTVGTLPLGETSVG